jgi:hypothetical protein
MQIVEVLDDRARDSRLVALLDKYHRAQRYISVQIYMLLVAEQQDRFCRQMKSTHLEIVEPFSPPVLNFPASDCPCGFLVYVLVWQTNDPKICFSYCSIFLPLHWPHRSGG